MADLSKLQVRKKSGKTEPFDRKKILSGVTKSGTSPENAEQVTQAVETWAETLPENVFDSMDIRRKVLEVLKTLDEESASIYESYKKPK